MFSVPRILEALLAEWPNSTPRFALRPDRRNGNINLNKYLISSSGDRIHNQSRLQSHFMPLRHDRPRHDDTRVPRGAAVQNLVVGLISTWGNEL